MTRIEEPRRVIVLGAGAIGASTGALLFESGVPCVLVGRNEHGRAIAEHGVDLRFPADARTVRVPTVLSVAEAAPTRDDLVILTTMGHDTEAALAGVDPAIRVASFQNGLMPLDVIVRRGHPTLAGVVYVPAERRAPGIVALAGVPIAGTILVGAWPSGEAAWMHWLVARLVEAGFRAEAEPDIAPWVRAKLLTNLGGIVVALCDSPPSDVVEAAQSEARAVWRAAQEPFEDVPALLARVGELSTARVDGKERVGGATRAALVRGDRLETASLHEAIVKAGREHGVPTPVNEGLIRLADRATRERWTAGKMSAEELRREVLR